MNGLTYVKEGEIRYSDIDLYPRLNKNGCDEVCELLGSPTKWQIFLSRIKCNIIAPIKRASKKIIWLDINNGIRVGGYIDFSSSITLFILGKRIGYITWKNYNSNKV